MNHIITDPSQDQKTGPAFCGAGVWEDPKLILWKVWMESQLHSSFVSGNHTLRAFVSPGYVADLVKGSPYVRCQNEDQVLGWVCPGFTTQDRLTISEDIL